MDPTLKNELISEAKTYLKENPQDPMHDISHHQRVSNIANALIEQENLADKINQEIVDIICWWHDVSVPGNDAKEGERIAKTTAEYLSRKVPEDIRDNVYDSIANHEFGSSPNYLEGKILQDADKLEILSEERVDSAIEGIRSGKLDKNHMLKTLRSIREDWLPRMPEKYHFEFSKTYHTSRLEDFLSYLDEAEQTIKTF